MRNLLTFAALALMAVGLLFARPYAPLDSVAIRCINISPGSTITDYFFYKTPVAITVTHVSCVLDGVTSVVMTLRECDANGNSCTAVESAMTCTTTTANETGAIDDPSISANSWLRITRGAVVGGPTQASMCVTYTVP